MAILTEPLFPHQPFDTAPRRHPALSLPAKTRVYAVGDLHGRQDLLRRMDRLIAEDLAARPAECPIVVFLGDYVDRGLHSADVVESLIRGRPEDIESVFLKGNHEDFLLDALNGGSMVRSWLFNGGGRTLESYGIAPETYRRSLEAVPEALRKALPAAHEAFFRGLPTWWGIGSVFFAHAGVNPDRPLDDQDDADLMWIRDKFLDAEEDFGALVVHGHSPCPAPEVRANRINCDTGAYATNRLTAAVMEGDQLRFLST